MAQNSNKLELSSVFPLKHLEKFSFKPNPPWVSEYYVNNAWFETAGLNTTTPNAPLLEEKIIADIAIVGGGFTGLSSAYHLAKKYPQKRIVLLDAARCGYGASGRNGGHAILYPMVQIMEVYKKKGREAAVEFASVAKQGLGIVKSFIEEYDIDCEFEETGFVEFIEKERQINAVMEEYKILESLGIESDFLSRKAVSEKFNTTHFHGGVKTNSEGGLNPCKLALGLKEVVQSMNVEIFEQTKVTSVSPGRTVTINTEFGEVHADAVVLGTNGYTSTLNLFKKYMVPFHDYVISTAPLTSEQMTSLGWKGREALADNRNLFNYYRLSGDNRIIFGGELVKYYYGNIPSPGNNKHVISLLEERLLKIWPQLKGVKIEHRWGGTDGLTRDILPLIGVLGEYKNIFYGVGYSGEGICWANLAGKIISQLYAEKDTDLTRFFLLNRKPPYIPPEPFRKIGFDVHVKYLAIKDRFF
ncbi:MAG: FAD-binding oxidoreductase [Desulfobacterales bacterium]|nr:FAD-binding oxidoreductase [Desulfobacterales bacterium]